MKKMMKYRKKRKISKKSRFIEKHEKTRYEKSLKKKKKDF